MSALTEAYAEARAKWRDLQESDLPVFYVGAATCGRAAGAGEVLEHLRTELDRRELKAVVVEVGCLGPCSLEPLVTVHKPGGPQVCYRNVGPDEMTGILDNYVLGDDSCSQWALGLVGPGKLDGIGSLSEHPLLRRQVRNVLRNCGLIDPENVHHYLAQDGYRGFLKALEIGSDRTVQEVRKSGIRGRGGAGFPTWQKWEFCRKAAGQPKYLICNADEGDPGAFMDRSLLEGDPHAVLEGMLIAAFALGASQGYVYCRMEYPLAIRRLEVAIDRLRELGLLGGNIEGSGFSFDLTIKRGAGAFVCGEETALIASIEGRRGMPRPRPPFPAVSGLWGKPTIIQNVETLGNLPLILRNGAEWYAQYGTETSKGTKTFALAGKVESSGLIEVPMGISLKDIVYDIGGGVPEGKALKAVQTGGPSGGCIPVEKLDLPVDYESLAEVGSIMGSGGMIVLDEDTCVVDTARYFLSFTQEESCGKCPPCRAGTLGMLRILDRIAEGRGELADLDRLEELAWTIKDASLCGLGQTAPNPVLSTLKYFRAEYEAHIRERRCPAGVCPELVHAPCSNECPAGVDVPLYISLIGANRLEEALASHLERNPFPSICARVCPHPCERKCRRIQLDSPVAIRSLKRYMADTAEWIDPQRMVRENARCADKKVAVIGAGPAGLSCAYFLRRMGYPVTVFEKEARPGGMMTYAIPEYRLPRDVLQKDIDWLLGTGIELKCNTEVGKDVTIADLKSEGYQAFFLGLGAWTGTSLGIPGEDLQGVMQGLGFLLDRNKGVDVPVGKKVAVIGGGDVAIDSARIAFRMGADVTVVYRRTRDEMPAIESEIQEAQAEGIRFKFLALPDRIEGNGQGVEKLICLRMKLGEFALDGRRRPESTDEFFELPVDTVIVAVGQKVAGEVLAEQAGISLGRSGRIDVDPFTCETEKGMFFAGGDAVTGPSIVLSAVGAGEQAAVAINEKLSQGLAPEDRPEPFWRRCILNDTPFDPEAEPVDSPRMKQETLPLEVRRSFEEVELAVGKDAACQESYRCLRCDYRVEE
ncbi:MAG: NADH-quinone oxidoreductase subunit NuoF [Phycisphaerales bacterium]|nr:MAG: NADH-quinone oxidoreductase subunit NuoF [Phycisphaerales bacterium]